MRCEDCRAMIEKRLGGEVPGPEFEAVKKHMQGCPACGAKLADIVRMERLLADAYKPARGTTEARAAIEAQLPSAEAAGTPGTLAASAWLVPAAACALVILGLGIGLVGARILAPEEKPAPADAVIAEMPAPLPIEISSLTGTVLAKRRGTDTWQELSSASRLYEGDVLQSASRSGVTLALGDDSTMALKANTTLTLARYGREAKFHLDCGTLSVALAAPHSRFVVSTPQGAIEALGTKFTVSVK